MQYWGTPLDSPSTHHSYRPLTTLTFRLNFMSQWDGVDMETGFTPTRPYHAVNVLVHALNGVLLSMLAARCLPSRGAVLVASLTFAAQPVHVDSMRYSIV